MPRPRSWTDDELIVAVRESSTMAEVHRRLGLRPGRYEAMIRHLERLDADFAHLMVSVEGRTRPRRAREVTPEEFRAAVGRSESVSDVARALGLRPSGGSHRWAAARIRALDVDTSHFDPLAYTRREGFGRRPGGRRPLGDILTERSEYRSSRVRARLISEGVKEARCEHCGLTDWRGRPLVLQLDHINGDHTDNRLENLRILCGNCHSQTDTWCNRRR